MKKTGITLLLIVLCISFAVHVPAVIASPEQETPWYIQQIHADNVSEKAGMGLGIDVALVDLDGIDKDHEDLANNVKGGISFNPEEEEWWYVDGDHHTWCAGIIGAEDNDIGIIGVAPKVSLWSVKIDASDHSTMADAINWCCTHGIEVISMNTRILDNKQEVEQACDQAYDAGVLLVAVAGNTPPCLPNDVAEPASFSSVIAVGATDHNNDKCDFSVTGPELELVAPGIDVKSTTPNNGYETHWGTSASCPMVAGLAALIWSSPIDGSYDYDDDGEWDNNEVRKKLQDSAYDLGPHASYGYGLIDGLAATEYLDEEYTLAVTKDGPGAVSKIQTKAISISQRPDNGLVWGTSTSYSTARTIPSSSRTRDLDVGQYYYANWDEYTVERTFLKFNTSTIPSGATITSAYLSLYGWYIGTGWSMVIQKWTGDTPIDTNDYNQFDEIDYGSKEMSSWIHMTWNNIPITNFGLIQKMDYTKICLRSSKDISSTAPTGYEFACVYGWNALKPPKLVVTYYTPGEEVEDSKEYPYGSTVNLIALPTDDFLYWILDNETVYDNPINITMDSDHTLEAYFVVEPVCAMKPEFDYDQKGYTPNMTVTKMKIEFLFDTHDLEGDQAGGESPYGSIDYWPNGQVDLDDLTLLGQTWQSEEGDENWEYIADVVPNGKVDIDELFLLSHNWMKTGSNSTDLTDVDVKFFFADESWLWTQPVNGYVEIPENAVTWQVWKSGYAIGALVTFWQ